MWISKQCSWLLFAAMMVSEALFESDAYCLDAGEIHPWIVSKALKLTAPPHVAHCLQ